MRKKLLGQRLGKFSRRVKKVDPTNEKDEDEEDLIFSREELNKPITAVSDATNKRDPMGHLATDKKSMPTQR